MVVGTMIQSVPWRERDNYVYLFFVFTNGWIYGKIGHIKEYIYYEI